MPHPPPPFSKLVYHGAAQTQFVQKQLKLILRYLNGNILGTKAELFAS